MANRNLTLSRLSKSLSVRQKTLKTNWRAQQKQWRSQALDLGSPRAVIWIFGCQRSGTTFLENVFRHDFNSVVFGEFSELTIGERKTVLTESTAIAQTVLSKNAEYAVIRPLFESDRAVELLDLFPNSVGVWLYRECAPVVNSMVRKWDDRFFEISRQVESDDNGHWRLEEIFQRIQAANKGQFNSAESYAQYWLARNKIPFRESLDIEPRMLFLDYKTLVSYPRECIDNILRKASLGGVWKGFSTDARRSSLNRSVDLEISQEIMSSCNAIYQRLLDIESFNFEEGT